MDLRAPARPDLPVHQPRPGRGAPHLLTASPSCTWQIVERTTAEIFARANHPYTQALIAEVRLTWERRKRVFVPIQGEIPSPLPLLAAPSTPAARIAMPCCREEAPTLQAIAPGHWSACHLNQAASLKRPAPCPQTFAFRPWHDAALRVAAAADYRHRTEPGTRPSCSTPTGPPTPRPRAPSCWCSTA